MVHLFFAEINKYREIENTGFSNTGKEI